MRNWPPPLPRSPSKNWRNIGGIPSSPPCEPVFTIREEVMVTTEGNTFFTTGAKLLRLAGSAALANLNVAGGVTRGSTAAAARPPNPSASSAVAAARFGRPQICCVFICPPTISDGHRVSRIEWLHIYRWIGAVFVCRGKSVIGRGETWYVDRKSTRL